MLPLAISSLAFIFAWPGGASSVAKRRLIIVVSARGFGAVENYCYHCALFVLYSATKSNIVAFGSFWRLKNLLSKLSGSCLTVAAVAVMKDDCCY